MYLISSQWCRISNIKKKKRTPKGWFQASVSRVWAMMLSHNFQVSSVFPSFWDHAGVEISNEWNCTKNWTYLWNIPLLLGHVVLTFLGYHSNWTVKMFAYRPQLEFAFTFCISITCMCRCNPTAKACISIRSITCMCRCNPTAKAMATVNCRPLSLVLISSLDNFMHLTSGEIRRPPTGVGGQPYAASCSSNDRPAFALHCPAMNSKNLLQGIQNTTGKYRSHDVFCPTSKGDADEALFPRWCLYRISKVNLLLACSYNILQ